MKRTKYDGRLHTYWFGDHSTDQWDCKATSFAKAVRMFRVGVLFPHAYSKGRIKSEVLGDDGYTKYVYRASKQGSKIKVRVVDEGGHHKHVASIPVEDPDAEYDASAIPQSVTALLKSAEEASGEDEPKGLIVAGQQQHLANLKREGLEQAKLTLEEKMGELMQQKRELMEYANQLRAELDRRMEQIWMIELFLGSKEEVHMLRDGEPAPASERITIRQRVLCMDEEIAVWRFINQPKKVAKFDYQDIEAFDDWLLEDEARLDAILPAKKGIVGLRVRRKEARHRKYADGLGGLLQKIAEEEADRCVYLLIRNGEQVYRLWVDVSIWPRFFPRVNEWDWVNQPDKHGIRWPGDEEKAVAQAKQFAAGLMVVQGLVQRSDLLHPLPKSLDVFNPEDAETYFNCVRDDEIEGMLSDGSELASISWESYRDWLRSKLATGVRAFWWTPYGTDSKLTERTGIRTLGAWPKSDEPYTLEEAESKYFGTKFEFLYLPDEDRWWTDEKRSRRVRFRAYGDEVWPVDFVSWRVVRHLLLDRGQREYYADFFPLMARWYRLKRAEWRQERPFIDMALRQAGLPLKDEAARARAERILRWWKIKTKAHRTLETDDAKALRMCVKELKSDRDYPDDPELLL